MAKLIRAGTVGGVPVGIHWTVFAGCALLILVSLPRVAAPICAILAYFAAVVLHEWGHVFAALRYRCNVYRIELYPFMGATQHSQPYSRREHGAIAWAGVAAQAVAAIPLLLALAIFGYTPWAPANAFLGTFVWLSVAMIVFNLLPIPPLDGALAWRLLPPAFGLPKWLRFRRPKKRRGWNALAGRGPTRRSS